MTYEEAIKELNELSKIENAPLVSEAAKMGAEALQKQVPMKPTRTKNDRRIRYSCPNCKLLVGYGKHCRNCGQKISWED